jgi:hypothetical protein
MRSRYILVLTTLLTLAAAPAGAARAEDVFPLRLVEASDGKLGIPAPGSEVSRTLTLVLNGDQAELNDIRIALGPVSREDGRPVASNTLTCGGCGKGLSIARGAWLSFSLAGTGLEPGATLSFLQISALTRTLVIPVTVTRAALTQTAQIVAPAAWAGTRDGGAPLEFAFDVRETSGRDAIVRLPSVTPLQVVDKSGAWRGVEETPQRIVRVASPGPQVGPADENNAAITLIGGAYTRFVVRFGDLPAGSYKGQIRLSGANSAETTQDFTLTVRDPPLPALLVIALGVALAFALNRWTKGERERRVRRISILNERDQMARAAEQSPLKPDPVWDELLFRLDDMLNRNAIALPAGGETADTVKTALDDLRARRAKYSEVQKIESAIDGLLAEFGADLAVEKERLSSSASAALTTARDALCKAQGQGLDTDLAKPLRDIFDEGRKLAISKPADALTAEIEGAKTYQSGSATEFGSDPPAFEIDRLAAAALVSDARSLADTGQFVEAMSKLEQARGRLNDLWSQKLARIHAGVAAKLSDDVKWQRTRELLDVAGERLADAAAAPSAAARLRVYAIVRPALDGAIEAYIAAAPEERHGYGAKDDGGWSRLLGPAWVARYVEGLISPRYLDNPGANRETAAAEVAKIRSNDWLVGLVVIAAACLTGFASLYLDAATFGAFGGRDYITAFLWGFGWQALTSTLISLGTDSGLFKA